MNDIQKRRFAEALDRVAGDEETLTLLATIVVEDAPRMIADLHTQISSQSLGDAASTAHSLKGLLSAFETGEPVSELGTLIEAARQGDRRELHAVHRQVEPKLNSLVSEIGMLAK